MKTKWFIIPVIALSLGCTRETIDINETHIEGEFTLYATSGEQEETRTVLQQDGRVFWSPGDCITVFYGDIPGKFTSTNTKPAASAEFTGSLGSFTLDGKTEFKAIYPYSDNIVMPSDEGILSIYLPPEQTAVEGTFADDLFICVAKSKDVNLHFYNVCGGVSFSLARDDIKKVVFRGNNKETLAGTMFVDFTADGIPQVIDFTAGRSSVTLSAPDGETLKKGSWYYLVSAPQVLSKGYTMELYTDELVETIISDSSVTIRRSAWGELKDLGSETSVEFRAVDLGLSVKWANMNLGAKAINDYGDYYSWGETVPNKSTFTWDNYLWGEPYYFTKYAESQGKTVLDLEDDAAYQTLKGHWRMATIEEFRELYNKCKWEKTTIDGVVCYKVSGNGNFIYFPAYPGYYDGGITERGVNGYYWSSTILTSDWKWAQNLWFKGGVSIERGQRFFGEVIRPVYDDREHAVESVSLNKTSLEIVVGDEATLTAIVLPSNATNKNVTWSSSNKSVATVSSSGVVKGVATGSAIITVKTADGGKTATCKVTVSSEASGVVDLGLSVKWASVNLGATKPEQYGNYYAWGETKPKSEYLWDSYRWCMEESSTELTKYCSIAEYGYNGFVDEKTELIMEDDAAHVLLGGKWRMPTREEQEELSKNCSWEWSSINGIYGCTVTGPSGESIFLPASGFRLDSSPDYIGTYGAYWSSSLRTDGPDRAFGLIFNSDVSNVGKNDRCLGLSIRPVYDQ